MKIYLLSPNKSGLQGNQGSHTVHSVTHLSFWSGALSPWWSDWFSYLKTGFWTGRQISQGLGKFLIIWREEVLIARDGPELMCATIYSVGVWCLTWVELGCSVTASAPLLLNCHSQFPPSPLSTEPRHCQRSSITWPVRVSFSSASLSCRFSCYQSKCMRFSPRILTWYRPTGPWCSRASEKMVIFKTERSVMYHTTGMVEGVDLRVCEVKWSLCLMFNYRHIGFSKWTCGFLFQCFLLPLTSILLGYLV